MPNCKRETKPRPGANATRISDPPRRSLPALFLPDCKRETRLGRQLPPNDSIADLRFSLKRHRHCQVAAATSPDRNPCSVALVPGVQALYPGGIRPSSKRWTAWPSRPPLPPEHRGWLIRPGKQPAPMFSGSPDQNRVCLKGTWSTTWDSNPRPQVLRPVLYPLS